MWVHVKEIPSYPKRDHFYLVTMCHRVLFVESCPRFPNESAPKEPIALIFNILSKLCTQKWISIFVYYINIYGSVKS